MSREGTGRIRQREQTQGAAIAMPLVEKKLLKSSNWTKSHVLPESWVG
jgi:hypothetical protein